MNKFSLKITFLGFLLFLFQLSWGQFSSIDSLKAELGKKEGAEKAKTFVAIGKAFIENNVDSTYYYATLANDIARSNKDSFVLVRSLNLLGNVAQRKGELDEAMQIYEEEKQLAIASHDDKGMAIVLNNIGIIYTNRGEYNKALEAYLEAIDYEKKIGDQRGLAEGLNNIGVVHYYMGDIDNTLVYLKKSAEISAQEGDLRILKKGYINIGAIHRYNKDFDEALKYYQLGLEISKDLQEESEIILCYHNIAEVFAEQLKYELAESYYRKALDFHLKFDNKRGVALEYNNLGTLYLEQGKVSEAKPFYLDAISLAKTGGFRLVLEAAYGGLSKVHAKQSNYKAAFESIREYVALNDSLVGVENSKNFAELRTKYETAEKEKLLAEEQIRTSKLEQDKVNLELVASRRSKWIVGLLALLSVLILLSLLWVERKKKKATAEKNEAIIAERDKGAMAVFNAQEEERKRISKDLHDGIGQQLSGLKMAFQKLGKSISKKLPEEEDQIGKLTVVLTESAEEVRSISHQMMPRALTELGLIEAIEDLLVKSLKPLEVRYSFEHFGIEKRLEERIEISLYRVLQELLNNIIKHSKANQVSVQLFRNQNKLILIVEDNGTGIKQSNTDGHGLLNIKSRVNTLFGELNLEPSPSSGTLATIRIPLAYKED